MFMSFAGLERDKFDNKTVSFEEHIKSEHNMWHYLYFIVLVKVKDPTEYTGPESYVAQMIVVSQFGHVLYAMARCSLQHERSVSVFFSLPEQWEASIFVFKDLFTCLRQSATKPSLKHNEKDESRGHSL